MSRFFLLTVLALGAFIGAWSLVQHASVSATAFAGATTTANPTYQYVNTSKDDIFVTSPKPGDSVTTTVFIEGYARGPWYDEAVFPVEIRNGSGTVIGSTQGKAQAEWTTQNFVPFLAELDLKALYNGPATVILKKDNPPGDPSKDASLSFPVMIQ